ncbi:MAG: CHAD domain-containing protein [Actinophytocola sp.]|nr:CHAD domain-containing protein [Actinophytocola sp.]
MADVSDPLSLEWGGRPARGAPGPMLAALEPAAHRYRFQQGARRRSSVTYLDTVDRRLRKKGLSLRYESDSDSEVLVASAPDGIDTTELGEAPVWPALAEQLPAGSVADRVGPAMWVRAVAPVVETEVVSREITARNEDDKIVARLHWQEATANGSPTLARVSLDPLRGYAADAERIARLLADSGEFVVPERSLAEVWLRHAADDEVERRPTITAGMRADVAVATALLGFLDAIERNVAGTIDDVDTEFLHDLRVAVRRSRSVLKLTGDALPERLVARGARELKWLGDATTPTRDLDVYLLELDELATRLTVGTRADLDDFATHLHWERTVARRSLVRALQSKRFERWCESWRQSLTEIVSSGGSEQSGSVEELARDRVRVAYKRVLKRANAITPDCPGERVHSLRKRAKELRYLLEMFAPVCDRKPHRAVVKNLKRVQDILGAVQDGEVQSASLRVFAERMLDRRSASAATLLAMGELSAGFAGEQRQARDELTDALPGFLGSSVHKRVTAMLP